MKTGMRPFLVVAGLSLVYIAFLLLTAKPPSTLSFNIPPVTAAPNVPYLLYLRGVQWVFGYNPVWIMMANAALMLLMAWGVFRLGWRLAGPRYQFLAGTAAMVLFILNPLAIVLPLTLGFLGGYLLAPLLLVIFINVMLLVENWSVFMRAIVLSLAWSLFLWVHIPTAIFVLMALVPWVLYNRRPSLAMGILLTVLILGTLFFSISWMLGCAVSGHWSLVQSPLHTLNALGGYLHQGLVTAWGGGSAVVTERFVHILAWLSPFGVVFGAWAAGRTLQRLVLERRAATADFVALMSLVIGGVVLTTGGKDMLPGAWYLLVLAALWAPLVAHDLAKKENFYTRAFRLTFLAGFVICGAMLFTVKQGVSRGLLVPDLDMIFKVCAGLVAAGAVSHALLRKHPLSMENRLQALLAGAAVSYSLVIDVLLLG
jgi:hypothetical protein